MPSLALQLAGVKGKGPFVSSPFKCLTEHPIDSSFTFASWIGWTAWEGRQCAVVPGSRDMGRSVLGLVALDLFQCICLWQQGNPC